MNTINLFSIALYGASFVLIFLYIRVKHKISYRLSRVTWLAAIGGHAYFLYMPLVSDVGLRFDIISASLQVLLLSNLVLFVTSLTRRIDIIALFIIPLTVIIMLIGVFGRQDYQSIHISGGLSLHILFSFLGYSLLFLATLQALMLSVQSRLLRSHRPSGVISSLPSLQAMEILLFRLLVTGVGLLTVGLLVGFIFLEDFFATERLHKTILSLVSWVIYTILILGHWLKGWRGNKAVKWTVTAFIILVLAFFGSKFVQEVLINAT